MTHQRVGRRSSRLALALTIGAMPSLLTIGAATAAHGVEGAVTGAHAPAAAPNAIGRVDSSDKKASSASFTPLVRAAERSGAVRAIVGLQVLFTPEGLLSEPAVQAQRSRIDDARRRLLNALVGREHVVIRTYETLPYLAASLSPGALVALQSTGVAASIQEDTLDRAFVGSSMPVVEATEARVFKRLGKGRRIVVVDTGVDKAHPFIGSAAVTHEACFAQGDNTTTVGDCPNGEDSMIGPDAGEDCSFSSACSHGTHVAGIAMGGPASGLFGVASSAKVVPIQVFSNFGGSAGAFASDQIAALNYIATLPASVRNTIAAVNMSLGSTATSAVACDADARKTSIDNLISLGIATVIAAGNTSSNTGVSSPGCISTAVTVGATTDADAVASFSNSSPLIDILAPGVDIESAVPGTGFTAFTGTSMATPHIAGAFAVLDAIAPSASVASHLAALTSTGKPVTDTDNAVTRPRLRLLSASVVHEDTGFKKGGTTSGPGYVAISNGTGLATRAGGPTASTIAISGIPPGSTVKKVYLFWMTLGGPDPTAVFDGISRNGTLVGASEHSCWNINQSGPNRSYRAAIKPSSVRGNGVYTISGVGDTPESDGQGASLLVIYQDPTLTEETGKVQLQNGAMTVNTGSEAMSHTVSLASPSPAVAASLHVGVADGNVGVGGSEHAMTFGGVALGGANAFSGTDGSLWDDLTFAIPTALIPGDTVGRVNGIQTVDDCLAWGYAAVAWRYLTPSVPDPTQDGNEDESEPADDPSDE